MWKYEHYICALGVGRARDRSRVIAPVDAVVAGTRLGLQIRAQFTRLLSPNSERNSILQWTVKSSFLTGSQVFL